MGVGVLTKYKDYLPVTDKTPVVSLGEGDTPLVRSKRIASDLGWGELYFKLEGCNPTGSFKDRLNVIAFSKGKDFNIKNATVSSSGNLPSTDIVIVYTLSQ